MQLTLIEQKIRSWADNNYYYTNTVAIARSLIALGTLLTLLCNPVRNFIPELNTGEIISPLLNPVSPVNSYNFFLLLGLENVHVMKIVAIILLALVILGYYPQITCLFHWWISISFIYLSTAVDGGDHIAMILTLLLIPLCMSDPRRNHWYSPTHQRSSPLNLMGVFSVWMIRVQVAIIYLHAATGKFSSTEWMDGTAVYYWFYHSFFGMPAWLEFVMRPMLASGLMVSIITYGVLAFELILFTAISMNPEKRKHLFLLAVAFHFMIILVHGIFSFFFSIAGGLVIYLLDASHNAIAVKVSTQRPTFTTPKESFKAETVHEVVNT